MYVSFKNNWLVWFEIHSTPTPIISLRVCVAGKMLLGMERKKKNCERGEIKKKRARKILFGLGSDWG